MEPFKSLSFESWHVLWTLSVTSGKCLHSVSSSKGFCVENLLTELPKHLPHVSWLLWSSFLLLKSEKEWQNPFGPINPSSVALMCHILTPYKHWDASSQGMSCLGLKWTKSPPVCTTPQAMHVRLRGNFLMTWEATHGEHGYAWNKLALSRNIRLWLSMDGWFSSCRRFLGRYFE